MRNDAEQNDNYKIKLSKTVKLEAEVRNSLSLIWVITVRKGHWSSGRLMSTWCKRLLDRLL